ncbi:MAG: glycine/betaine/sarcosine/D-proline family reductase selenoprotein B [Desulfobacterales bacterium]|nr:glycine/betaine/sarcosine/D-proline family reductase selenoprotein B [Desulfobacterales bacterium]
MSDTSKTVDGFLFLPPALRAWISKEIPDQPYSGRIPWTPLGKSISETTFTLMTSAGISMKSDPLFDMEREKNEPAWGDPSYREIPKTATERDIEVNHLHINTAYIEQDINVMLPLKRFQEFEQEGLIGKLAPTCYSYYGYQLDPTVLLNETMPQVADRMRQEKVEAVLLTPT